MQLNKDQIEAMRAYLLDLECPFNESSANTLCDMALKTLRPEETFVWNDANENKPNEGEDVLVWHVLGDTTRANHAYDVAVWVKGKWIFPWDRNPDFRNPDPQWVRAWAYIPSREPQGSES